MTQCCNQKFKSGLILLAGFLIWVMAMGFVPQVQLRSFIVNGIGSIAFFVAALLLPRCDCSRCINTPVAIGWMSFLMYLSLSSLLSIWSKELVGGQLLLGIFPILIAYIAYAIVAKIVTHQRF